MRARLHAQCLLCGAAHPRGLRLRLRAVEDGRVEAPFACGEEYQGYAGRLHGGVIAALLDSAMTQCLFAQGYAAVTGELRVKFVRPLLVGRQAIVSAHMAKAFAPLFYMEGEVRQEGAVAAWAKGKFMLAPA